MALKNCKYKKTTLTFHLFPKREEIPCGKKKCLPCAKKASNILNKVGELKPKEQCASV